MSNILGHRHPRTVATWRNLDKARRSQASLRGTDFQQTVNMRSDHEKLLLGGTFSINAYGPPVVKRTRTRSAKRTKKEKK